MTKKMLIDATHDEETRVAIVDGYKLLEFDYESKFRKPLKGSIFLAKVTRVEPSLQAAFVNFGGNRHGFLPFSEIHPDYFRIPIADREALLAEQQAVIEEMAKEEEAISQDFAGQDGTEPMDTPPEVSEGEEAPAEMIEEIQDEKDAVEEIGGHQGFASGEDAPHDDAAPAYEEPREFPQDQDDEISEDLNAESFDGEGEALMPEEGQQSEQAEGAPEGEQADGENAEGGRGGRRGRGGRYRRGGRGRHGGGRGRHRMAHSSRQVESFGGEEYDDDGGNDRFRFNLRRKYKIQEVIKRGQIMLVQVSKEERGNKGAAVSTYLSLPGRYCVLMPNSPRGGGVSRKIASYKDRARMREIVKDLEVPQGMSVIVRTAGVSREKAEIQRDLDYLMRLWDNIRELTLQSSAPTMVYEEADLIKRAVRDLYGKDIDDVVVAGHEGYETAHNFMKMLVPSQTKKVIEYTDESMPLFNKYKIEEQIAEIGEGQVTLPSGGYLVINQTEALVAIDVNSGKATKERHIEETALKTNMEAASELARQLRLRDLGGLIVVDFIDMEDRRNNAKVERRMRDALSTDRARIQMGRISSFGLMELSRQRLNPSLTESQFETCKHCKGMGRVRTCDATSIMVLRALEEEGIKGRTRQAIAHVSNEVAIYILNNKRKHLTDLEKRYGLTALIRVDETVGASSFRIEAVKTMAQADREAADGETPQENAELSQQPQPQAREERGEREDRGGDRGERGERGGRRRGRRGGRNRNRDRFDNDGEGRGNQFSPRENDSLADDAQPPFSNENNAEEDAEDDNRGNREEYNRSNNNLGGDFEGGRRGRGGRGGGRGRRGGRGRNNRDGGGREGGGRGNFRDGNGSGSFRDNNFGGGHDDDNIGNYRAPAASAREPAAYEPAPAKVAEPAPRREEQHARNFETVNEAPKEKKRGWWSKGE